jgi:hypothetical protein
MRFILISAASTFILQLVNALSKPTNADMKTMSGRRISNIQDDASVSASTISNW